MSFKGSPHIFFRRSIEQGSALNAWGAAHELGRLSLADALALSLVVLDGDRPRYDRLAARKDERAAGSKADRHFA